MRRVKRTAAEIKYDNETDTKVCTKCGDRKEINDFHVDSAMLDGHVSICKTCKKLYTKSYKQRKKTPKEARRTHLKAKYGVSPSDYISALSAQDGKCAICGTNDTGSYRNKNFCVDHCHETGDNRGILCTRCNMALGLLDDNIVVLENAIAYLKRGGSNGREFLHNS